jgi:hypothetical protein
MNDSPLLLQFKSASINPLWGNNELTLSNLSLTVVFVIISGFIFFKASYAELEFSIINLVIIMLLLDGIYYMRNIGKTTALSKRYFNKQKIKEHFLGKKSYSSSFIDQQSNIGFVNNNHKHGIMTNFEAKIEKNYILLSVLDLQQNTFLQANIDKYGSVNYAVTNETINLIKSVDLHLKGLGYFNKKYNVENIAYLQEKKNDLFPIVGLSIMNYTTKLNSLSQIVDQGVLDGYLSKGISVHDKNALLAIIKSDLDYERTSVFIRHFILDDMRQQNIIDNYSRDGLNVEHTLNDITAHFFSKMPITQYKFNNSGKTREEFLKQLEMS